MPKTNVLFQSYPNFSNNAKVLYEYMNKHYKNKMNLYWVIDNTEDYNRLKDRLNCVLNDSEELAELMPKIDIIFTTHGQLTERKLPNQIYINLWHGLGMKKLGYMLETSKLAPQDVDYFNRLRRTVDYMIVPSEFWRPIFASKFRIAYDRVLPIGYPKLDMITSPNTRKKLEKILKINLDNYKKKILYVPTFRKGIGRADAKINTSNIFSFSKYDENKVIKFLEKNNYLLCIKRHPSETSTFSAANSENIKAIENKDLKKLNLAPEEILNNFDLIISDYSSMGIEFQILNRPVLFITEDYEEYEKNRGIIYGLNFWTGENQIKSIDELLKKIRKFDNIKCDPNFRKLLFEELYSDNCKRVCEYLFSKDGNLKETITPNDDEIINKALHYDEAIAELNSIYNSKGWNYLEKLRKIKNKFKK